MFPKLYSINYNMLNLCEKIWKMYALTTNIFGKISLATCLLIIYSVNIYLQSVSMFKCPGQFFSGLTSLVKRTFCKYSWLLNNQVHLHMKIFSIVNFIILCHPPDLVESPDSRATSSEEWHRWSCCC